MAPVSKRTNKFTVILEEEETGFSVHCPALPGCLSQGDDRQSALDNIKEAIELVLDVSEGQSPCLETPAMIADEIREVLNARKQDGLPYSGIFLEQVEIAVKAIS